MHWFRIRSDEAGQIIFPPWSNDIFLGVPRATGLLTKKKPPFPERLTEQSSEVADFSSVCHATSTSLYTFHPRVPLYLPGPRRPKNPSPFAPK